MKLLNEYEIHQTIYNKGYRFNPQDELFFTEDIKTFVYPEDEIYKDWKVKQIDRESYLNERLAELDVKKEQNAVILFDENDQKGTFPIFTANKHGDIEILQYSIHRKVHFFERGTTSAGTRFSYNAQVRLNPNYAIFCEGKYDFSEAKNTPFWHPELIKKFEEREPVETLVITEGQFKAWKATADGIPTVGLTSIAHFRNVKTKEIHTEIIEFIRACDVKNIVILWDGDCRNISSKNLEEEKELTTRPHNFYSFARTIKKSLQKFFKPKRLSIYFATIKTDEIATNPKGIDDLLLTKQVATKDVLKDFANIGAIPGYFLDWINITSENGEKQMRQYFNLQYVSDFYNYHAEQIKQKNFIFYGTTYKIEKGMPVVEIDKNLKKYLRIGPDYFRLVKHYEYNNDGEVVGESERLTPWKPAEITRDFGKEALNHVQRLDGFCNVPNHVNYMQIINNKFNLYSEIKINSVKGDFPNIKNFLKHIFQEQFEMGLDYIQLLYQKPYQKLPVLGLVSKQQGTGKSTFLKLLFMIFQNNMTFVTPEDIMGQWSSHWSSKLIVASEETNFDKKEAMEKIKNLSTADKIMRNERFVNSELIDCFLKFIFLSNFEDDFIKLSADDTRFWIIKVKKIAEENKDVDLESKMMDELPHFMHFLLNRELKHEKKDRMWFDPKLTKTAAWYNIVSNSEPGVVKDLRPQLEEYFEKYRVPFVELSVRDLKNYFNATGNDYWLNKVMVEHLHAEKSDKVIRYSFYVENHSDPLKPLEVKRAGRPLKFYANKFMSEDFFQEVKSKQDEMIF